MADAIPVIPSQPEVAPVPKQARVKAVAAAVEDIKSMYEDAVSEGKYAVLSDNFVRVDN